MSFRNILDYFRRPEQTALEQAMTVEPRPGSLAYKDFREFTAPARRQRGASLRLAGRGKANGTFSGIIPQVGGNIP